MKNGKPKSSSHAQEQDRMLNDPMHRSVKLQLSVKTHGKNGKYAAASLWETQGLNNYKLQYRRAAEAGRIMNCSSAGWRTLK